MQSNAICTYCSKEKDLDPRPIPAISRYVSARIKNLSELARQHGVRFLILSGKFGLLDENNPVEYYDHLLQSSEVSKLIPVVTQQIREKQIEGMIYYTKPPTNHLNVRPYLELIHSACRQTGISLLVEFLEA